MKKALWESYLDGLRYEVPGEGYKDILRYVFPELVTALISSSLVNFIDGQCMAHFASGAAYATMSFANTLLHFLTKVAEGLSVGTMILCGLAYGRKDVRALHQAVTASAVATVIVGGCIAVMLFGASSSFYVQCGAPENLSSLGKSFLQLKAITVFLMFIFFSLIGFLRGITKNHLIIKPFIAGTCTFIIADYLFVMRGAGDAVQCLSGAAHASILQYLVMVGVTLWYIVKENLLAGFFIQRGALFHLGSVRFLCQLSFPVMIDKALLAFSRIILVSRIAPLGQNALSAFGMIRDFEMLAFVPAIAYAHVVTFLVSNGYARGAYASVRATIKKVLLLALCSCGIILSLYFMGASFFIQWFDPHNKVAYLAVPGLSWISLFAIFDVVQVVLSGALRGMAQVRVVLITRLCTLLFFSLPAMYLFSLIAFHTVFVTFITVYSSFYLGNGLMSLWYLYWLRSNPLQQIVNEGNHDTHN